MSGDKRPRKSKSRYALKTKRKCGRGRIDPKWMWWMEPR